jgi:N-acyl-D-aspartate/D-glutamate deacylase
MAAHDLVIRGGTVIDGTGAPRRTADVAVSGGVVTEVGDVEGRGRREVDADGALVLPGFVDIHCHYDGQATWDERLQPSSWHGATTVVMGNCGVGFAPVKPTDHLRLVQLMEGVEDIPGTALHEGLSWQWTSFGEFLDAVDARPHDIDVAAQVPHSPIRLFAMGERGADHEERSTAEEIAEMGRLAAEGIAAGALGFSTSRTMNHRTSTGAFTPTLTADRAELVGIAEAIGVGGRGVLQMVGDFVDLEHEFDTLVAMMRVSGRPLSFSLAQSPIKPDQYRDLLSRLDAANAEGHAMRAQVAPRAVGILLGLDCSLHPFVGLADLRELAGIDGLPLPEQVARLADPAVKERVLDAARASGGSPLGGAEKLFLLADPPDYEPGPDDSVAARAARDGVDAVEWVYDRMQDDGGRALF